jgi:hypothetical protein
VTSSVPALCARRERPSGCRAAEQRDEFAPPHHSITSSAMASSVGGTVRPERPGGLVVDDQFQPFEIMLMVQWVIPILALA